MSSRIPCFVKEHNWPNSFAFATTTDLDGTVNLKKQPPLTANPRCVLVRSCEDPNRKLFVQLSGPERFQYVLLNARSMEFAGFSDNEEALVESVEPTTCDAVEIAPLSSEDFQVIEANTYEIEGTFLNQCRLVSQGMVIPFFASGGRPVLFKIVKIHPETSKPVLLSAHTELHVAPVANGFIKQSNREEKRNSEAQFSKIFTELDKAGTSAASEDYFEDVNPPQKLRVLPKDLHRGLVDLLQFNDVYTMNPDKTQPYGSIVYVAISTLRPACPEVFARLHLVSHSAQQDEKLGKLQELLKGHPGHCLVSSGSPLSEYERLVVKRLERTRVKSLREVEVCLDEEVSDRLVELGDPLCISLDREVRKLASDSALLLGNQGTTVRVVVEGTTLPILLCPTFKELSENPHNGKNICFRVTENTRPIFQKSSTEHSTPSEERVVNFGFDVAHKLKEFSFQNKLIDSIELWLNFGWGGQADFTSNHLLILGPSGSGRSSLLEILAKKLAQSSKAIFSRRLECSALKGKQAEKLKKQLLHEMELCTVRSPAVIFLDGIDLIAQSNRDEEHRMLQIERIFMMLRDLLKSNAHFQFVFTAKSLHSIHPILVGGGGNRFFGLTLEFEDLALNDRLEVLSAFLHSEVPLEGVAKKTEGFTVAELERLARRVQIATAIRGAKLCNEADLENGLENSRPLSTNQLETQVEIRLDEVGGMKEQKKTLEELLLWPGMYPNLFARCGVRMGRGVLLCGPSGCGKTILAKAFAAHTKFQTIFIKGPELLSKYIGSSEENVRNAFARARASAPCVLLFDELDSLAPRRGADSTGVTDRVVNQLLTEMDGAEGLNGVFVLGCTSRVDLIDPALLRPGRFDHKLVCDAPSEEDREEILEIVLKKIARQGEFNLKKLAEMSDSWTGADLNAWMLNAHFLASRKTPGEDTPITMDDILATFEESRPKDKREQIAEFKAGQRVTLA